MTYANMGAAQFTSPIPPKGQWMFHDIYAGAVTVNQKRALNFLSTQPSEYEQNGYRVQVPCFGIRLRASVISDANVGSPTLRATKLQLGSFFTCNIVNGFENPYQQVPLSLARLHFIGCIVNAPAQMLDLDFFSDDPTSPVAPAEGLRAKDELLDDVLVGASPVRSVKSRFIYPSSERFDSYWRAREFEFTVRAAAAAATTLDLMYAVPLCAIQSGNHKQDSLPLNTLCAAKGGAAKTWQIELNQTAEIDGRLTHNATTGGSITINGLELWTYNIPVPLDETPKHGVPWWHRNALRNASPFIFNGGELPLFSGTLPTTEAADDTFVDTVDGEAYTTRIVYPNINADFAGGNFVEYMEAGAKRYPSAHPFTRGPREVYRSLWDSGKYNHKIRTGLSTDVSVFGGRANAGLGYANVVDADMEVLLGTISSAPVRVFVRTDLSQKGFPGLGTLGLNCGNAQVVISGSGWNTTDGSPSSIVPQDDILVNLSEKDRTSIQQLGANCCTGSEKWRPLVDNPDSTKAPLIEGLTGYEVDPTMQRASNAAAGLTAKA